MTAPQRILVFRNGSIGNTLAALPAMKCIRQSYPDAHIIVVLDRLGKELLSNENCFDSIVVYDRRNQDKGIASFINVAHALRKCNPDTAILFKRFTRNGLLALFSGARKRFGFVTDGKAPYLTHTVPYDESIHVAELNLRLAKAAGANAEVSVSPELTISNDDKERAKKWLADKEITSNYIIAHFGGTTSGAQFVSLSLRSRLLTELTSNAPTLLIGNGEIEDREARELARVTVSRVVAVGESLRMTISLISQSTGFIGTNSGPMHIAAATQIPGIALFNQSDRFEVERVKWGPMFPDLRVVPVSPMASDDDIVASARSIWRTK